MSFVGPRPALFNQDDLVGLRTQHGVYKLVPGLTGLAQVNGRDELPIPATLNWMRRTCSTSHLCEIYGFSGAPLSTCLRTRVFLIEAAMMRVLGVTSGARYMQALKILLKYRGIPVVVIHLVLVVLANYLAFWLRFDGQVQEDQ